MPKLDLNQLPPATRPLTAKEILDRRQSLIRAIRMDSQRVLREMENTVSAQTAMLQAMSTVVRHAAINAGQVTDIILKQDQDIQRAFARLPISILKLSLDLISSGEIIEVFGATVSLFHAAADNVQTQIERTMHRMHQGLLTSVAKLYADDHAEHALLSHHSPVKLHEAWDRFIVNIIQNANSLYGKVIHEHISDTFINALINEYMRANPDAIRASVINDISAIVTGMTRLYLKRIESLNQQTSVIYQAMQQKDGRKALEHYFQKLRLCAYVQNVRSKGRTVTGKILEQLERYFPEIFPSSNQNMLSRLLKKTNAKMNLDLLIRTMPQLQDQLIDALYRMGQGESIELDELPDTLQADDKTLDRRTVVLVSEIRRLTLFSHPQDNDNSPNVTGFKRRSSSVVLTSHKPLTRTRSDSDNDPDATKKPGPAAPVDEWADLNMTFFERPLPTSKRVKASLGLGEAAKETIRERDPDTLSLDSEFGFGLE